MLTLYSLNTLVGIKYVSSHYLYANSRPLSLTILGRTHTAESLSEMYRDIKLGQTSVIIREAYTLNSAVNRLVKI